MTQDSPQILAIKERYKASFPDKADAVKHLLSTVQSDGDLDLIKEEMHKLAGSSGMYGYEQISAVCRSAMSNADERNRQKLAGDLKKVIDLLVSGA